MTYENIVKEKRMIKKKYLKSMVALVLAGTLTMQSAAVYAMDFDDGSAGVSG